MVVKKVVYRCMVYFRDTGSRGGGTGLISSRRPVCSVDPANKTW